MKIKTLKSRLLNAMRFLGCFGKEVTSFYRNYSLRNSRNFYLSVNYM